MKLEVYNMKKYSAKIGHIKSFKNVFKTYIVPILALLIANYVEWLQQDIVIKIAPLLAYATYWADNYRKNHK